MKKIIEATSICLLIAAVLYGAACFITWEINPAKWDSFGKAIMVFFHVIFSVFSIAAKFDR